MERSGGIMLKDIKEFVPPCRKHFNPLLRFNCTAAWGSVSGWPYRYKSCQDKNECSLKKGQIAELKDFDKPIKLEV
jgi:hypothetical protein